MALAAADARKYGVNPQIFTKQIGAESNFDPNAQSSAGAEGIAQIVPRWHPGVNTADPVASLDYAAQMDGRALKTYGGDYRKVLAAYNAGGSNADKYNDPNFAGGQTYNYVNKILGAGGQPQPGPPAQPQPVLAQAAAQRPQINYQPQLTQQLAAAAGQQGVHDLTDFYSTLGQAIQAKNAPTAPLVAQPDQAVPVKPQTLATGHTAVSYAKSQLGVPYEWGGETAGKGFDCSGLLQAAWKNAGVNIPRTTYDQFRAGTAVPPAQLEPGDAVFFKGSDSKTVGGKVLPGHVGIYLGGGKVIEAPHTGTDVQVTSLAGHADFMGARRYS